MSDEAMALERLLLRSWEFEGFLGQTRVRIPRAAGWPELDVVAYNPLRRAMRVGEVKVRFGASDVLVLDASVAASIAASNGLADAYLGSWVGFTEAVCALYPGDQSTVLGLPAWPELETVEVAFVLNAWELPESGAKEILAEGIRRSILDRWNYRIANPHKVKQLEVRVETTMDLLVRLIGQVREAIKGGRGARFGDPFLDAVRELLRYLAPSLSHVPHGEDGKVGNRKEPHEGRIKDESLAALLAALGAGPTVK